VKTHIFTTLSKSFETTIKIPEQWIYAPWPSSVWMRSRNMPSEQPIPTHGEMHPPVLPYCPLAEIVAMSVADKVEDVKVDEETDPRTTNTLTAK
jgi:hypothetical protein